MVKICLRQLQMKERVGNRSPVANPEQKRIIEEFCRLEVELQSEYLRKRYRLRNYNPQLFINHNPRAVASYGGSLADEEPYISLALHSITFCVGETGRYEYDEYNFLRNKKGIGDGAANWKQWTAWLIAHELAHTIVEIDRFRKVVQRHYDYEISRDLRGHGKLWQEIYRELRCKFCTKDKYKVHRIDFSDMVYHGTQYRKGEKLLTFYKGSDPIKYYIRSGGVLYESDPNFKRRRKSKARTVLDIKRTLVTT